MPFFWAKGYSVDIMMIMFYLHDRENRHAGPESSETANVAEEWEELT